MSRIPLIDLRPFLEGSESDKKVVAHSVDDACRDIGFLLITGHGVSPGLRRDIEHAMTAFFSLPVETKARWAATPDNVRGYRGMNATALSRSRGEDSPPDLMERFTVGQFDVPDDEYHNVRRGTYFQTNRWPDVVPSFEQAAKRYYREMERLAADLMRLFASALNLPERHFERYFDKHISVLVTNFYPPQLQQPKPGQLRAGAHTDYGSLTILAPSISPGGLQVRSRDGSWEDVPQIEGSFVINIGDLMAQWTNDRWVSTMHRVVNPGRGSVSKARMSIVFFQQPNDDAIISCIPTCTDPDNPAKYEPVSAGAHVSAKLNKGWIGKTQPAQYTAQG
jgi:isopenicillin N synthase-like dioxygenase